MIADLPLPFVPLMNVMWGLQQTRARGAFGEHINAQDAGSAIKTPVCGRSILFQDAVSRSTCSKGPQGRMIMHHIYALTSCRV